MIQNLILSLGLSFAIGLNGAKDNHDNYINNDIPNNVAYDDVEYEITLSADELNNYTWQNFYNYLSTDNNYQNVSFSDEYTDYDTDIADQDGAYIYQDSEGASIIFLYDYEQYNLASGTSYDKNYVIFNDNPPFTISLKIVCGDNNYTSVKNAIELDIQVNAPAPQPSMGNTIINAIKSGLGLIGDLASQFLLGFSTLFWANNSLTSFGTFALVMLGVAIVMAVVSLVLNIIRNNTGA